MAAAAARPMVSVQLSEEGEPEQVSLPGVFTSPIRPDVVGFVHTQLNKNKRQAYAVKTNAGHQTAAESWGTGRAVSRIPRVPGGGTHRAGQGAFGNMCRGGSLFSPTKTWRRWHRRCNISQKRYAACSALAAAGVPALVMARGHKIDEVPEIPLVVSDSIEKISKTSKALELLKSVGCFADIEHVKASKKLRKGKGKMRNRRYVMRRGPLVIYASDSGITKSFRNIPGIELCHVDRLNLLQLAPGGHMGRMIVFTRSAFEKLDAIYGSTENRKSSQKKSFTLPRNLVHNADITRIINSDEVQSIVNPPKEPSAKGALKRNALKKKDVMIELNPYYEILHKEEQERSAKPSAKRQRGDKPKSSEKFYQSLIAESDYAEFDAFQAWLTSAPRS